MISIGLFVLILFSFLNLLGALPRVRGLVLFVSTALVLIAGSGLPAKLAIDGLQTHPRAAAVPWSNRNVIVVLGGGAVRWPDGRVSSPILSATRLLEARRLYGECATAERTCSIIASGGDPARLGQSEAETMARELVDLGVPRAAVILEDKSQNTFQNARFTHDLLPRDPADVVVLVTSAVHVTRSLLYFSHFGPRPRAAPADHLLVRPSWIPSSYNLIVLDLAAHEWLGIAQYQVYQTLGWTLPTGGAGAP